MNEKVTAFKAAVLGLNRHVTREDLTKSVLLVAFPTRYLCASASRSHQRTPGVLLNSSGKNLWGNNMATPYFRTA